MEPGIYERLVTRALESELAGVGDAIEIGVDAADQPHVLARHVESAVRRALSTTRDAERRLALANRLLEVFDEEGESVAEPARQLYAVRTLPAPGVVTYGDVRPSTPLAEAALLTNTRGEPSLGSEVKAELDTSDGVDLLCAFVKWYGLRLLERNPSCLGCGSARFHSG